jgi:hypothetical protein
MKKTLLLLSLFTVSFNFLKAQSTTPGAYCVADFDDAQGFPVADAINNVSFGTLNNTTNGQFAAPHYVHYNNLPINSFTLGTLYQLSVAFDVHGGAGYGVWIDFDQNNAFDANEKVSGTVNGNPLNLSSNTVINESILIPTTALTGSTRMRVRIVEDDMFVTTNLFNTEPCNAGTTPADVMDWGETEDYTITIAATVGISKSSNVNQAILSSTISSQSLMVNSNSFYNTNYQIINVNGQMIQNGAITQQEIDIQSLESGLYFIQILNGESITAAQKFMKTSK